MEDNKDIVETSAEEPTFNVPLTKAEIYVLFRAATSYVETLEREEQNVTERLKAKFFVEAMLEENERTSALVVKLMELCRSNGI